MEIKRHHVATGLLGLITLCLIISLFATMSYSDVKALEKEPELTETDDQKKARMDSKADAIYYFSTSENLVTALLIFIVLTAVSAMFTRKVGFMDQTLLTVGRV